MKASADVKQALIDLGYSYTDVRPGTTDQAYTVFERGDVVFTIKATRKKKENVSLQDVIDTFTSPNYHL